MRNSIAQRLSPASSSSRWFDVNTDQATAIGVIAMKAEQSIAFAPEGLAVDDTCFLARAAARWRSGDLYRPPSIPSTLTHSPSGAHHYIRVSTDGRKAEVDG